ncbi:MAG: hypothetical protein IKB16_04785 [Lentisphaeria bacterium]|nr:hypothetical protein [Lentisphaeria bacterium]
MKMKSIFVLTFLTTLAAALCAAPLPETDWELKNGKIMNWSGKVTRTANNAMEFSGTTYTKRKYIKGNSKTLNINLAFQGKTATVAMYIYDKKGAWLGTVNSTRIPNASKTKNFDIVFKIPEKNQKNKDVFSFRVVFSAPKKCTISKFSMSLDE